jgi:hypothetical protein
MLGAFIVGAHANDAGPVFEDLNGVTEAVVLIIPFGVSFRAAISDNRLSEVSCVYQIKVEREAFNRLVTLLQESVLSHEAKSVTFEARIATVFNAGTEPVRSVYFEDWGGRTGVRGRSGNQTMSMIANLPERLRSLMRSPDVTLVRDNRLTCPHS